MDAAKDIHKEMLPTCGTGISLKEDASVIRERDIQADRRSRSQLLIASENPFCAAPGIIASMFAE
jgi:hypothetical protein